MKQLFSHYFTTPPYLVMNSCALDISDMSIKYGEIVSTSHGLRLKRFGKEKISKGIVGSGKIQDEVKLIALLKDLKKRLHLKFVRVSLPEEQVYLFTLSVPKTSGDNLRDIILLQIEEHIPLKANETIFDYEIISENANSIFIEVVAIATLTIESYLSVFSQAGLSPLSFELEAQAIARSVVPMDDPRPVMIVDFGDTRTGVSIVQNGIVFFTTTLDVDGISLTNMIAKNFGISFEEAELMKVSYGKDSSLNSDNSEDLFSVVLGGVSVLRDEINKQYIYWKTHEDDNITREPISRIILCGGDSNLVGLASYLESSLSVKVEYANAWANIADTNTYVPEMSFSESLEYVTVLGLSLGDHLTEHQSVINVLPLEQKRTLKKEYRMRLANMSLSFLALIALLASVLLLPSYFFSMTKESLAEAQLESFNANNPEIALNNTDSLVVDINNRLTLLNQDPTTYQVNDKILSKLLALRPKGITFSQILYGQSSEGKSTIDIQGLASDRSTLRDFKSTLESNTDYASVNLPISDFLERTNINFNISITMK